jgi:hypothetical protein
MYTPEKAIEWCTDDCFIHKLFNRPVRKEYIDLIYIFCIFIIDFTLILYHGQQLSTEELDKLQQNIDVLVSINGFLSTSW